MVFSMAKFVFINDGEFVVLLFLFLILFVFLLLFLLLVRATLRISSQHIANWLLHKVVSEDEIMACFHKMAKVVDGQNAGDAKYRHMDGNFETSNAVKAALELCFDGCKSENGYTEPVLTKWRRSEKEMLAGGIDGKSNL